MNFTIVDDKPVVFAPSFFGSNPAVVRDGPKQGTRALRDEEEAGRALMAAFNDAAAREGDLRRRSAPREMITAENREAKPLDPRRHGLRAMTPAQRRLLEKVHRRLSGPRRPGAGQGAARRGCRRPGMDKITFGWAGVMEVGGPHYYRVQGPTFLIEYDNTQNNDNHIHSVWRDFNGDFGRDLLREHYKTAAHD